MLADLRVPCSTMENVRLLETMESHKGFFVIARTVSREEADEFMRTWSKFFKNDKCRSQARATFPLHDEPAGWWVSNKFVSRKPMTLSFADMPDFCKRLRTFRPELKIELEEMVDVMEGQVCDIKKQKLNGKQVLWDEM